MHIDIQQVQHIITLVSQSSIQGLSIHDGQQSLHINKWVMPKLVPSSVQPDFQSKQNATQSTAYHGCNDYHGYHRAKSEKEKSAGELGGQIASIHDIDTGRIITANHVGYLRLRADNVTPVLVAVGDTVKEGQTLAYVQSTVKMLPITAKISGKITKILAEDGDKIEYGQALFALQ